MPPNSTRNKKIKHFWASPVTYLIMLLAGYGLLALVIRIKTAAPFHYYHPAITIILSVITFLLLIMGTFSLLVLLFNRLADKLQLPRHTRKGKGSLLVGIGLILFGMLPLLAVGIATILYIDKTEQQALSRYGTTGQFPVTLESHKRYRSKHRPYYYYVYRLQVKDLRNKTHQLHITRPTDTLTTDSVWIRYMPANPTIYTAITAE